jgi:hypothetical protein
MGLEPERCAYTKLLSAMNLHCLPGMRDALGMGYP